MNLLQIDSSILGPDSASRKVTAAIVERLAGAGSRVTRRDLGADPLPHLTAADLGAADADPVLAEFLAADTVVIGAPMYNFSVSSQLKAWIDHVLRAGKTFRYGPNGAEGLAGDKRVLVVVSRGGLYGAGAPAAALEHTESYLRSVFGFIGIVPEIIVVEGLAISPDHKQKALDGALQAVAALAA
jgi:FMN-dependent NADH-azoreductase